jgi:hypothetical protein
VDRYEPGARPDNDEAAFLRDLTALNDFCASHGKVAALTETGCRKDGEAHRYPDQIPDFWSRCVLAGMKKSGARLAWVMSWYQIDYHLDGSGQIYLPYVGMEKERSGGQAAIDDFRRFAADPAIVLGAMPRKGNKA